MVAASRSTAAKTAQEKADAMSTRMRAKAVQMVMSGTTWHPATELFAELPEKHLNEMLSRWLKQGRLFAIDKDGVPMYPRYAFDAALEPLSILRDVLEILRGRSPLEIAAWFESTSGYLDGKRPREMLLKDGAAVVMAAQRLVEGPVHG